MKCIVTGGAGFIGSNLTDRLIDDGHEVIIFDDLSTGFKENINPKARFNNIDVGIEQSVPYMVNLMEGVDVVFHMACLARVQPSIENPYLYHDKNVNGLVNVLEACRENGVKRLFDGWNWRTSRMILSFFVLIQCKDRLSKWI